MPYQRARLIAGVLGFLLANISLPSQAGTRQVNDCLSKGMMSVSYTDARDYAMTCSVYAKAIALFSQFGFAQRTPFAVVVLPQVYQLAPDGDTLIKVHGMYSHTVDTKPNPKLTKVNDDVPFEARTVYITSLETPQAAQHTILGLPRSAALHESIVLHELVHAISRDQYAYRANAGVVDEYIAYSLQIYSLPISVRNQVLALFPEKEYGPIAEAGDRTLNPLQHVFDPTGFAVRSYRHFMTPHGGNSFLQRIYQGDIREMHVE